MAELATRGRPWTKVRAKSAKFTQAAEASNVIKVTCSLFGDRRKVAGQCTLRCWLTQNTTTLAIAGTAPATSVAIAAKGAITVVQTAKLAFDVVTDANGEFDLNITDTSAGDWYLCVEMPDGSVAVSSVINFHQPAVVSLSPTDGTTAGGTALTITGTDFVGDETVDVGGAAATSVVVVSTTSITCVTPARTAGAKAVTVTSPTKGVSNADVSFTYS